MVIKSSIQIYASFTFVLYLLNITFLVLVFIGLYGASFASNIALLILIYVSFIFIGWLPFFYYDFRLRFDHQNSQIKKKFQSFGDSLLQLDPLIGLFFYILFLGFLLMYLVLVVIPTFPAYFISYQSI